MNKLPQRSSKHQIKFRLDDIENNIFHRKLKQTNLTKHEYLLRLVFYDFVWYTQNEKDFINTINNTSYQISMICRNLKMIIKQLEDEFWDDSDIEKIKIGIKEIEQYHLNYINMIKVDQI